MKRDTAESLCDLLRISALRPWIELVLRRRSIELLWVTKILLGHFRPFPSSRMDRLQIYRIFDTLADKAKAERCCALGLQDVTEQKSTGLWRQREIRRDRI